MSLQSIDLNGNHIGEDGAKALAAAIEMSASQDMQSGSIKDPKGASAGVSFMWDNDYLYLLADVNDREIVCTKSDSDIQYDDCFELYIETGGATAELRENEYMLLGFAPTGPDGKPQVWEWRTNSSPDEADVPMASKKGVMNGFNGYHIEAAVSWKYLGIKPADGTKIRLCPAVHDFDVKNDSNGTYTWFFMREGEKVELGELTLKK